MAKHYCCCEQLKATIIGRLAGRIIVVAVIHKSNISSSGSYEERMRKIRSPKGLFI